MIFPGENAVFHKMHVFASNWKSMETTKKTRKNRFKTDVFFEIDFERIFEPTCVDLGLQVGPQKSERPRLFCVFLPKSVPRAPKSAPRASQEHPKSIPRVPKSAPRALSTPQGRS